MKPAHKTLPIYHFVIKGRETAVTIADVNMIAAGIVFSTATFWWDLLSMIPDALKFIGLAALTVYSVFRAANEVWRFINRRRGGH